MHISIDKKQLRFYLWVALGFCILGVFSIAEKYPGQFLSVVFNNIWAVAYLTVLNFILFEYSVSFVLKKRKFIVYNIFLGILLLWLQLMLYSFGAYVWKLLGVSLHIYTDLANYNSLEKSLEMHMGFSTGSFFIYGISRHIYTYTKLKQATQKLRIEKQAAELNYLKSQTNPHFLFNTLNNIYSLARDKNDLAPESILRLSKILRFMLYETGGSFIAVEQELKIMDDYIALEKLRYDESLFLNFNYDVEDMKQAIPPLLLIPLVENAFKHGASETRSRPFVDIHLSIAQRQLEFRVKNSTETYTGEEPVTENIGLSNLRRQLELLYTDYNLVVQQNRSDFTSVLKINLSSHV